MSKKTVCIINSNPDYVRMFRKMGWKVQKTVAGADLIQFTGGEDVSPVLYRQKPHPSTNSNMLRDEREALVFAYGKHNKIPMAGICRGGQFLNVMCGGEMWQDADNHATHKGHPAFDERTGECIHVTSTHHQIMLPHKKAELILWAQQSTRCTKMGKDGSPMTVMDKSPVDTEAVYYEDENVFCFQPHPEFPDKTELARYYFNCLDELLFRKKEA